MELFGRDHDPFDAKNASFLATQAVEAAKAIAPGSIVNVRGEDGREFGTGYFNTKSLITVRMTVMRMVLA